MELCIKQIRRKLRISQTDLSESIGVSLRTVGSWERGQSIPNAEQVWNCAVALNCTPNDILGWKESGNDNALNSTENELIDCYRESTPEQKDMIMMSARNAALVSKSAAERNPLRRDDEAAC